MFNHEPTDHPVGDTSFGELWSRWQVKDSCVYELYNKEGIALYVGKSAHVRSRLSSHYVKQPWITDVASVIVTWGLNEDEARDTEARRTREIQPLYNRATPTDKPYGTASTVYTIETSDGFYISARDAAKQFGMEYTYLTRRLKAGTIPGAKRIGRRYMVPANLKAEDVRRSPGRPRLDRI